MQSIACALSVLAIAACSMDESLSVQENNVYSQGRGDLVSETMVQGMIRVKFTEDFACQLYQGNASDQWNDFAATLGVTKIERTFPYAGEFEARTRKEGMHLWYNVYFDSSATLTKASNGIADIEGVAIVECLPKIEMSYDYQITYADNQANNDTQAASGEELPVFDDPGLSNQWHYYNDGTISEKAVPGADINVLPVWKEGITGSSEVIVVVTDMGVDYNHEDLKDNMWTGTNEQGNIINGYNFYDNDYVIIPGPHATHIAGTIAAVNNNGIGVCGIAGGDAGNDKPGVKIMTCQIATPEGSVSFSDGQGGAAIKWAADHGAVISQNSWQYTQGFYNQILESDRDAFDYFVKYAGMDSTGTQTGPMAGGVIFFACGNAMSEMSYPQSYEKVIAVSSIKSDFSAYKNNCYGPWVDLSAPGGDKHADGEDAIYSTLPDNKYGYMHGTSMASPHAAGVAALIVSHCGGPGFTAQELKFRLFSTLRPLDNTSSRLIGHGLVDAANAILGSTAEGPEAVSDLHVVSESNKLNYSFTVPEGKNKPVKAYLLLSGNIIDDSNYQKSDFETIDISGYESGRIYEGEYFASAFDTLINVALITIDDHGGTSGVSNNVVVSIGRNHAPVIESVDGSNLKLTNRERIVARFVITDEDGHDMAVSLDNKPNYMYYEFDKGNDTLYLTVNGKTAPLGSYSITLSATDPYGLSAYLDIYYEISEKEDETEKPQGPDTPEESDPIPPVDSEDVDFVFYPNPVLDNLYIKSSEGDAEVNLKMYSHNGALLMDRDMTIGSGSVVDMTDYPAGNYSFKVTYKDQEVVKNIVKL